jgi:IS6 family transposase
MPKIGGFQSFRTARKTIDRFEAKFCLKKGFGFTGVRTVRPPNEMFAYCFASEMLNKA